MFMVARSRRVRNDDFHDIPEVVLTSRRFDPNVSQTLGGSDLVY